VDGVPPAFNGVMLVRVALVMPAPVAPGDVAIVVAPSSPQEDRDELWPGLAWLRARYRLRMSPGVLERHGYLAGSDERRRAEIARAMLDPEAKAIVVMRGGYGAMRIATDLPWAEFARAPKWIVGFSDVSALHAMAWRSGVGSVHAPNAASLGRASPEVRAAWLAAIERPRAAVTWSGLRVLHRGVARGSIAGGNLSILHAMAAAGRLAFPAGAVVALEDVSEAPYRVDRMLTSLLLGGYLENASAVVFGSFERCGAETDPAALDALLLERTSGLGVPVLAGAPFGHGAHNLAFVQGAEAAVDGGELTLG
jgi:muramoyltetrapeptide carboxypeptidase